MYTQCSFHQFFFGCRLFMPWALFTPRLFLAWSFKAWGSLSPHQVCFLVLVFFNISRALFFNFYFGHRGTQSAHSQRLPGSRDSWLHCHGFYPQHSKGMSEQLQTRVLVCDSWGDEFVHLCDQGEKERERVVYIFSFHFHLSHTPF